MVSRRQFLGSIAVAGSVPALVRSDNSQPRKKIAFLGTTVFTHSHSQHFLDRFAVGYAMGGQWRNPACDLASVFIDQFNENDIGRQRIEKYRLKQYSSIAQALTLGGSKLAVDGVLIIGEHGNYPVNEKGQTLYPRYQWFKEVVRVFEESGRSVPVFNDKHLSTDWKQCVEMVEDSRRLKFPLYAGSSLPVTWRLPSIDMPYGVPLQESVCVAYGGVDSYDFHALETAQCMSERRRGGEVGIERVHALRDEALWKELDQRETTKRLFLSALSRSHYLPVETGFPTERLSFDWARRSLPNIVGYFIEHRDGFRTAIFLTGIRDFNYAGLRSDTGEIVGCQMMLPMPGSSANTADFFNPLSYHVEQMILTGSTIYPVQRTLLTSGMVIAAVDSLHQGQVKVPTPDMEVVYHGPKESTYWRN
jgi:hypothetical protein